MQFGTASRNAMLDALETAVGTSPTMEIRTGAAPANCAAADSGTLLATIALPSDWMAAASGGTKAKAGSWNVNASGTGTAGHYRVKTSGAVVEQQGTCGIGTGDLQLDNTSITPGQSVTVTAYTLTAPNA